MKWKNKSKFHICGLNQEKFLNELSGVVPLSDIERNSKNDTTFKCSYVSHKKVEKFLKKKDVKIESVCHEGLLHKIIKLLTCYGAIAGIAVFFALLFVQNLFVMQYEVLGADKLEKREIVDFVKSNFSSFKDKIVTEEIEISLVENFERISFASCIIRGQTLVMNIKEKLMPEEMYGEFAPIFAKKDAKITKITLISGTLRVKVGDLVKAGDVLVEPYTLDSSGNLKKVEAQAEIEGQVYNVGTVDHYERFIEVKRTGRVCVQNSITLFGLKIYSFKEDMDFKMYEVEKEDVKVIKNLLLPFKMQKTNIYELEENVIESRFEDIQEEYIEKARQKALQIVEDCDRIIEEYHTIRHLADVTIVNFCIVTQEVIC